MIEQKRVTWIWYRRIQDGRGCAVLVRMVITNVRNTHTLK